MIRVNKLITTVLVLTISASLNAVQMEVTPTLSKAFETDGDSLKDDEVMYGLRGSIYFNENVALQVGGEASTGNVMQDTGETDIERVYMNYIYEKSLGKKFHPYAIVGGGYEKLHRVNVPKNDDESQPFVNIGAGLKYDITDRINLVTEAKWLRKLENEDDDIVATIGVGIKLGGVTKDNKEIPSVTETSQAENAASLAQLNKIVEAKKELVSVTPIADKEVIVAKVIEESIYIEENSIPSNASVVQVDVEGSFDEALTTNEAKMDTQSGYYVQLEALFASKTSPIADRLEKKNYQYIFHDAVRNGKNATLLLVGPYSSRSDAKTALQDLRELKSDAFIYRLK